MPICELAFRQRERVIERVWTPFQPEFFTAAIGGAYYSKTFPKVQLSINKEITKFDSVPYGFYFMTDPIPGYKLLTPYGGITVDPMQISLLAGQVPDLHVSGVNQINQPGTITPEQQAIQSGSGIPPPTPLLRILPILISPGKSSKPLQNTSTLVKAVTLLANTANIGTIWITTGQNQPAGVSFPLVAGAALTLGDITAKIPNLDLSTIFVIGTDAADQVFIMGQA